MKDEISIDLPSDIKFTEKMEFGPSTLHSKMRNRIFLNYADELHVMACLAIKRRNWIKKLKKLPSKFFKVYLLTFIFSKDEFILKTMNKA